MKHFLATFSLVLTLALSGSVFANDIGPIVLESEQLDKVNGGVAFAFAHADAGAVGVYFSLASSVTSTVAVSIYSSGLSASGSDSRSNSVSLAY